MAAKTNAEPLPILSETYGIRLPPPKYCLTAVDFDLLPNKPPLQDMPAVSSDDDEEDGFEDEEDEAEVDVAMEEDDRLSPRRDRDIDGDTTMLTPGADGMGGVASMDALGLLTGSLPPPANTNADESESDDGPDGLFEDDDEDEDQDEDMQDSSAAPQVGEKRKLDEDDEYD